MPIRAGSAHEPYCGQARCRVQIPSRLRPRPRQAPSPWRSYQCGLCEQAHELPGPYPQFASSIARSATAVAAARQLPGLIWTLLTHTCPRRRTARPLPDLIVASGSADRRSVVEYCASNEPPGWTAGCPSTRRSISRAGCTTSAVCRFTDSSFGFCASSNTGRYTDLTPTVVPEARLPKMTRNTRMFGLGSRAS